MFCSVMSCQTPFGYAYEGRCTARSRYSPFQNISFYSTPLYTYSSGLHFPGKHLMLRSSCISPALSSQVPSILLCSSSQYPLPLYYLQHPAIQGLCTPCSLLSIPTFYPLSPSPKNSCIMYACQIILSCSTTELRRSLCPLPHINQKALQRH